MMTAQTAAACRPAVQCTFWLRIMQVQTHSTVNQHNICSWSKIQQQTCQRMLLLTLTIFNTMKKPQKTTVTYSDHNCPLLPWTSVNFDFAPKVGVVVRFRKQKPLGSTLSCKYVHNAYACYRQTSRMDVHVKG